MKLFSKEEKESFAKCLTFYKDNPRENMIGDAVEWINGNLNPEDVFTEEQLLQWAVRNKQLFM
jgi:hypothetical protein